MTLRELQKMNLFPETTRVYMFKHYGSVGTLLKFDNKVNLGNLETMINEFHLNKEISFLEPKNNAVIVYFKED